MFLLRTLLSFFKDKIYRELLLTIIVMVSISTMVFHFTEKWSWLDSVYFSVSTITTTGYGDLYPKSTAGKVYNIFFLLASCILILMFINTMNQHYNSRKEKKDQNDLRHKKIVKQVDQEIHTEKNN